MAATRPRAIVIGLDCPTGLQTARTFAARGIGVFGLAADATGNREVARRGDEQPDPRHGAEHVEDLDREALPVRARPVAREDLAVCAQLKPSVALLSIVV